MAAPSVVVQAPFAFGDDASVSDDAKAAEGGSTLGGIGRVAAAVTIACLGGVPKALAQGLVAPPPPTVPLTIIAHVDAMPPHADEAKAALLAYAQAARAEAGARRIEIVQEVFPNHFDVVEVWADQKAYSSHLSGSAWRRLRAATNPWLGSPINERVGTTVSP